MKTAAILVLTTTLACSGDATGTADDELSVTGRADKATLALVDRFWNAPDHYFRTASNENNPAGYWIYAQAFDAVLDAAQRHSQHNFNGDIHMLYEGQAAHGWTSDYFDDESWMALALIRAYDVTTSKTYLDRAEQLFADIDRNGYTGTGVWWNRQHVEKATASNFGPALVAARLSERTGIESYKEAAIHIYDYWYSTMVDHPGGRVADHKNPDGSVDWSKYTYNTGLGIAASIELWHVTGNAGYLSHAYSFGDYMIQNEVVATGYGDILHDDHCTGDCDAFKGIAYRALAKLYEVDQSKTAYKAVLVASANAIWNAARNPTLGIFDADWVGGSKNHTSLAADASAVIALNIAAEDGF